MICSFISSVREQIDREQILCSDYDSDIIRKFSFFLEIVLI